jgi:hypothetical protein
MESEQSECGSVFAPRELAAVPASRHRLGP